MNYATAVLCGAKGGAWLLNIWDDLGDLDEHWAFRSGLAARRFADQQAGQPLDWAIEPSIASAEWEE